MPYLVASWPLAAPTGPRARTVRALFSRSRFAESIEELLDDPALDAVAVATPVPTTPSSPQGSWKPGKHCFVEKPLALNTAEAEQVLVAQRSSGRLLMVGHLLEYHPGVQKLKEIVDSGELGDVHYIYSNRLNLGKLRADENALWSLGAHDVSVVLHLAGEEPYEVAAHGECYVRPGSKTSSSVSCAFPRG